MTFNDITEMFGLSAADPTAIDQLIDMCSDNEEKEWTYFNASSIDFEVRKVSNGWIVNNKHYPECDEDELHDALDEITE